ncbi:hypothetical protein ACFYOY_35755 [Streptomyces sp. NPDC007875]|uniref:hypothetical protein n=1 Tax=Streptomyces sp. NPDC007875 TaxID=3364783 RepID=UPI0036AEBDA5
MSEENFAAVLAQVIPVVILAIVVEARHQHQVRINGSGSGTIWNDVDLYFQTLNLVILTFLEVAALITARGHGAPAWIRWFAGLPGAVVVGILLVVMGQIYIASLADAYDAKQKLKHAGAVKVVSYVLLGAAIAGGVVGIIVV